MNHNESFSTLKHKLLSRSIGKKATMKHEVHLISAVGPTEVGAAQIRVPVPERLEGWTRGLSRLRLDSACEMSGAFVSCNAPKLHRFVLELIHALRIEATEGTRRRLLQIATKRKTAARLMALGLFDQRYQQTQNLLSRPRCPTLGWSCHCTNDQHIRNH